MWDYVTQPPGLFLFDLCDGEIAGLSGVVAWIWFGSVAVGVVIGLAMIVNLLVAGLAGTPIPLMLERFGVDPAVASSVFLTTLTDIVGFFVFLGLAALILL